MLWLPMVETKIREVLAEFDTKGCSLEDLNKAKTVFKTSAINVMDGVQAKALKLSHWSMMLNKSYNLNNELADIEAVTTDDVMRVFRTYIKDKKCLIINVVPQAKEN